MEQISNNGWKIITKQWNIIGMVVQERPMEGGCGPHRLAIPFCPALSWMSIWSVYLEVVELDSAQIWLLFIKYLQWLAAFINEFPVLTKKEVVLSPYYKEETGSERLGWLQWCSHLQYSSLHHLSTQVQSMLFCTISHYRFKPERGWENRLWLIYWRLWLPREAEQDFQLPSVP